MLPVSAEYTTFQVDDGRRGVVDEPLIINLPLDSETPPEWSYYNDPPTTILAYPEQFPIKIVDIDLYQKGGIDSTPVIANGKAYYVTTPSKKEGIPNTDIGVYCIDLSAKTQSWYTQINGGGVSGLTIKDGKLYFGSVSGKLYCLSETDGSILWSSDAIDKTAGTGLSSTPLVVGNTVYVTTQTPAALWSFSTETGEEIYNNTLADSGSYVAAFSSPSTNGKYIYSAGAFGISAFNPDTKSNIWDFTLNEAAGTPVYSNELVFFATKTTLYAVNATTGEKQWETNCNGFATSPAVKDNVIVANSPDGLTAYNTQDGTKLWRHTPNNVSLLVAFDNIWLPTKSEVLDISVSPNSPVIAGDMAYYTANAHIYCVPSDGSPKFTDMYSCVYGVHLADGLEPSVNVNSKDLHASDSPIHPFSGAIPGGNITFASPVISNNLIFLGLGISPDVLIENYPLCGGLIGLGVSGTFPEYLYHDTVTVPPSLTVTVQGITTPYASPLGLVKSLTEKNKKSFSITGGMITAYDNIANNDTHSWRMQINGKATSDITTEVHKGDRALFYYGPTEKTGDALYALEITTSISDSFATINLKPDYKRAFTPEEKSPQALSAVITDWKGDDLTPSNDEISWTTNTNAFQINPNGLTLTYTPTGQAGDSAVFTIKYTPENGNSTTISAETETLRIYKRLSPIPSNPAIETTQTYITWKGNYARTGVVMGDGPTTAGILWDVELPVVHHSGTYVSLVSGSPVVHKGRVYVSAWNGGMAPSGLKVGVFCFDANTGEEIWNNPTWQSRSGMFIAEDKLYVSGGSNLVCLSLDDGHLIWKTPAISVYPYAGLTSTPIVYNGVTYVNTITLSGNEIINNLYGFDAETGKQIVKINGQASDGFSGGAGMFSSPSMSPDGVLYVPGAGGVYAVDTKTNAKLWEFDAGARSTAKQGSVTISGGNNMYVGSPIYKDQCVYFVRGGYGDEPTYLYCLDAITGKEIRKHAIYSSPITPVITDDKVVTLGAILNDSSSTGGATAYNLTTGEMLWHYDTSGSSRASPIVAGDIVYFGTYTDGLLYAVDINSGKEVWHYKLPNAEGKDDGWFNIVEGTPAIENGILYIGGENGHFYAFKTDDNSPFTITGTTTVDTGVSASFTTNTSRSYNWDFGDGTKTTGTASSVKKIWKTAGTYTVTASSGTNTATFTVTVTTPPKAFNENPAQNPQTTATVEVIATPTQVPANVATEPGKNVSIKFSNEVIENEGTVTVQVTEYQAVTTPDAEVNLDTAKYTTPPNTQKAVFLMNVSTVGNVKQTDTENGHRLAVMAKLIVSFPADEQNKNKICFWRYIDGQKDPIPLKADFASYVSGVVTYNVYVPGFSTIVATVDKTTVQVVTPPSENAGGGGGGGSSTPDYNGITFTNINPGTGTISYTTNHPDWPATTFTFDRMTALGVLLASGKSVVTAERWGGVYIDAIDGLSPANDKEGWMYQVNGISPGAMANSYPVQNGDKVVWYYSEDMSKPVSASKKIYAFTVSTSAAVSEITGGSSTTQTNKPGTITPNVVPAETNKIKVGIPDGIGIEKLTVGQKITIDTAVTKKGGLVSINARNIIIIRPGMQIIIPLSDVSWNGEVATATIRGMTAEIVPAPASVPKGGIAL